MPIWLEELLTRIAMPACVGLAAAAVGLLALALRRRRTAAGLLWFGIAWLWLWSMPAFVDRIAPILVQHHPTPAIRSLPRADAIVVLLSYVVPPSRGRDWALADTKADSLWHGARLFAAGKAPVVVVSGTNWFPRPGRPTGADIMKEFLSTLGVPKAAVLTEGKSRTTYENAAFVARLASEHDIDTVLLVTRGRHMSRALGAFRKAGLDAIPASPTPRWTYGNGTARDYLPSAAALLEASKFLSEWLAAKVYAWRGWI